ncbi:MAG: hypothetical protein WBN32_07980, partial [Woeseia sp.]
VPVNRAAMTVMIDKYHSELRFCAKEEARPVRQHRCRGANAAAEVDARLIEQVQAFCCQLDAVR